MNKGIIFIRVSVIVLLWGLIFSGCESRYFSPVAIVADSVQNILYIAGATSDEVVAVNLNNEQIVHKWKDVKSPSGLALRAQSSRLFVTCAKPEGYVAAIDLHTQKKLPDLPAGHTPMSPVISRDGKVLYICNRFNNDVWLIDIEKRSVVAKIPVLREPVAMTLENNGRFLFVANHLPAGPANTGDIAAAVSVIDISAQAVSAHIRLPDGSSSLRGICISPDNRYVFVTHILAKYHLPTTQLERGWMNTNALSIIDAESNKLYATVILDDADHGAANPWAVVCSADGRYICVTHAGTHEVSVIDAVKLFEKLKDKEQFPRNAGKETQENAYGSDKVDVSNDLAFLVDIRHRMALPGKGPRSIALIDDQVIIGEYFSNRIVQMKIESKPPSMATKVLSLSDKAMDDVRQGEMLFNDASLCFQNWQSCASCHPDVRADGLNWDLLNDGAGNPKNTKSLLLSMQTPPVMISGIRDRAETAVRTGFKYIQFNLPTEKHTTAIDAYLRALKPIPSPFLQKGKLSQAAERGKKYYAQAGCASCHPGPLFTDMIKYDAGTGTGSEKNTAFDTPALIEVWRTAPYLYDGRAVTIQEVLKEYNNENKHGNVTGLNSSELQDLIEYILSL
ncbi:MAG: c-type cytochrome [Bacteroidales bacterium]|nr:c-type cytochrome [Bacteroidales bacterium]